MKKLLLLLLAIAFISVPNTLSLFSNAHTLSAKDCTGCHQKENNDFILGTTPMTIFTCKDCHPFNLLSALNESGHDSTINPCSDCHSNTDDQFILKSDAHNSLYQSAISDTSREYANEACFLCHSGTDNIITYIRPEFVEYDVEVVGTDWIVQNLTTGIHVTYQILLDRNNGLHTIYNGNDTGCAQCHTDITDAISTGGHYPVNTLFHTNLSTCDLCHDNWNSGIQYQHVAKSIFCTDCHSTHTGNIGDSINNYQAIFQGNICYGCHKDALPHYPSNVSTTTFRVYLEPASIVMIY